MLTFLVPGAEPQVCLQVNALWMPQVN